MTIKAIRITNTTSTSGVLLIPNINTSVYKKLKYSCASTGAGGLASTGGYRRVGQVIIGRVRVVGQQWDWGWSHDYEVPIVETETRPGATRRTAVGPQARVWSMAWTEGVDLSRLRDTAAPDFLSDNAADTTGFAARADVPFLVAGMVAELRGGEVPIVVLPKIPTTTTTITDPTLFMYGRIAPTVRVENIQGDEGSSEVYRVAAVTVTEIT